MIGVEYVPLMYSDNLFDYKDGRGVYFIVAQQCEGSYSITFSFVCLLTV